MRKPSSSCAALVHNHVNKLREDTRTHPQAPPHPHALGITNTSFTQSTPTFSAHFSTPLEPKLPLFFSHFSPPSTHLTKTTTNI